MTFLSFFNETKKVPYESFETNNGAHSLPENELPTKPHLRKATDQFFLVLFIASIILLVPFLAYTLYHADINRHNNYDECGNICGQKNIKLLPWNCSGEDMTDSPYLNRYDRQCQSKPNFWSRQTVNVWVVAEDFALISLFPLGLCLCLILFFQYATAVVVWTILILFLLFLAGLTILAWLPVYSYEYVPDYFMVIRITISVLLVLFLCGLIIMRSKIHLVTMLFRKGTRAVLKHKEIFLVSAMALLLLCIILVLCITTTVYMNSAAIMTTYNDRVHYRPNNIMVASICLNLAVTLWVMEVIIGIYYMTVSGIVAEWYFNRNKNNFRASVSDILCTTLKYHLGTIALGSLIFILFGIPRIILKVLEQFLIMNKIMDYCMRYIKVFLTKNSYVATAIHGTPFFQSCKKTINLLMVNVGDTTAVNFYGDLVMSCCQFLVVGLFFFTNMFVFYDHMIFASYSYASYMYVFGISIIFCSIILGTVEAAFNSILLCVCQESFDNNVPNQPNAISMMETLKQSLEKGNPPKISEEVEKPKENV